MISIVIVSYNTRELLRQCLRSIEQHCPQAEVFVVDNASRDGSPAMVRADFPQVRLIETGRNAGFAAANNAGLKEARGEYLVLLNSDTVLEDDALQRCVDWMQAHPEVGACSPSLMGADGHPQQCVYAFASLRAALRECARLAPRQQPEEQGWLAGTCLVLRAQALAAIGGTLDDHYWMYWEDADLSARLLQEGWKVEHYPGAQIIHHGGASGGGADATRRADLHAWFLHGKYRWLASYRPWYETAGVWMLDLMDVGRKLVRGVVRPQRRQGEWKHARVLAVTLARELVGGAPPRP
ncbi:MAG: glycosyltransferase family 2 protein [Gemmataceae bacterium]